MASDGVRERPEGAAGGKVPEWQRALQLLEGDMLTTLRRQGEEDDRKLQELNERVGYLKRRVEHLELQYISSEEQWIAEGAGRQRAVEIVAQPVSSVQPPHDSVGQPGPSLQKPHGSGAQPVPFVQPPYGSVAQPGPCVQRPHDSVAQPEATVQGEHGFVAPCRSALLTRLRRSPNTESQDLTLAQIEQAIFSQEQEPPQPAPAPRPPFPRPSRPPSSDSVMTYYSSPESIVALSTPSATDPDSLPSPSSVAPPLSEPLSREGLGERLIEAAREGNIPEISALQRAGADANYMNERGQTPLSCAAVDPSVRNMLRQMGAHSDDE